MTTTRATTIRKIRTLGKGEIVLVVDAAGAATGFRWSNSAHSQVHETAIKFGRL